MCVVFSHATVYNKRLSSATSRTQCHRTLENTRPYIRSPRSRLSLRLSGRAHNHTRIRRDPRDSRAQRGAIGPSTILITHTQRISRAPHTTSYLAVTFARVLGLGWGASDGRLMAARSAILSRCTAHQHMQAHARPAAANGCLTSYNPHAPAPHAEANAQPSTTAGHGRSSSPTAGCACVPRHIVQQKLSCPPAHISPCRRKVGALARRAAHSGRARAQRRCGRC